ncbi:MAG: DUF559 domain-containing protein [Pseudorhodoplanes sp.]|nr:hypothetical protein [Pseudorhodoplanes sp.]MBW7950683.1 DUF559 domain-containing protein [Pseudorhodoplanes sp.]
MTLLSRSNDTIRARIPISELFGRISALKHGEFLTAIGIARDELESILRAKSGKRSALFLERDTRSTSEEIVRCILDDLATLVLERWPSWYGTDQLKFDVYQYAAKDPYVSLPWFRAASRLASSRRVPRFRRVPADIEFLQLMHALDPEHPILIAEIDVTSPKHAAPLIYALEWCANRGASFVAILPTIPLDRHPYDRILYGALDVIRGPEPPKTRFIVAHNRAHHGSLIEQRVEQALANDPELSALFVFNKTIVINKFGTRPRVDLLWHEGRVVVELDGPEHQDDPKFSHDRHRDYELLIAGYVVLRITNQQVETDLQLAIEKIRSVVNFRKTSLGMKL